MVVQGHRAERAIVFAIQRSAQANAVGMLGKAQIGKLDVLHNWRGELQKRRGPGLCGEPRRSRAADLARDSVVVNGAGINALDLILDHGDTLRYVHNSGTDHNAGSQGLL